MRKMLERNNPILRKIDTDSPLSVGNGSFAFTADVTGMQSLYRHYEENHVPLCTMSEWGWHSVPGNYTLADLELTEYKYADRTVRYPVERKPGSEHIYNWLREQPHKFNLVRVALWSDGAEIQAADLQDIEQTLDIGSGKLISKFSLNGKPCKVTTVCDSESDTLAFRVWGGSGLTVRLMFPYGSHEKSASDWNNPKGHTSTLEGSTISRKMDSTEYKVQLSAPATRIADHCFEITEVSEFTISFGEKTVPYAACEKNAQAMWSDFWQRTKTAKVGPELERRMLLSLYLSRIQGCGYLPPAETGLTLNSWYGRFHLEMHLWHSAYLPLYNQAELLERSLKWYKDILPQAKENAAKNGYKGARWPKQVAQDGIDSPSPIAPLLVWQQPHIIYMLELVRKQKPEILQEYWEVVKETAIFMCDFLHLNEATGKYELIAPLIPAQENHRPTDVKNPTFELEYFHFGLGLAIEWAEEMGEPAEEWTHIRENIADSPIKDGLYLAHENCPDTFQNYNRDHPSMLCALGLIPGERIDRKVMKATLEKVMECWNMPEMWGWDFAVMAMTASELGMDGLAMELLLMDTPKNTYVASGNNFQKARKQEDLPLYLPGNGSLLLALAIMGMV